MECFLMKLNLVLVLLSVCAIECSLSSLHESVVGGDGKGEMKTWTCPFEDSDNSDSMNWDLFLNNLFCKLSEYKIQAEKRDDAVPNTGSLGRCEKLMKGFEKRKIDQDNFERKFDKLVNCVDLSKYARIKEIVNTEGMIEELNDVLEFTMRDKLHVTCKGGNVYMKGNYITASDIIDILQRNAANGECKRLLSGDQKISLNIFALNTFFIDVNINSSFTNSEKIVLMNVLAPKWEIIGKHKIELNGANGETPEEGLGIHGTPGKPGSPGGNFFGLGSEFVNSMSLEISVSGGDGSDGLEGEKGEDGANGETPPDYKSNCGRMYQYCDGISDFNCEKDYCGGDIVSSGFRDGGLSLKNPYCYYKMQGKNGTEGTNGGNGGKGGTGGYPGNIELIELNEDSQIVQIKNAGQNGSDGKGGTGGLGGRKGDDKTVRCGSGSSFDSKTSNQRAQSGKSGSDGSNAQGMKNPEPAVLIENLDKAKIINEYKSYLRENLHRRFASYFLNGFLIQLETNTNVNEVYDTLGFIDDLQHLEEQVHTLNTDLNFIPFYQSFLNRTSEYAYDPTESGDPITYKKVLCYLYTAALGTIHNMEDNLESNLIIDIYAYLSSVKNDLDKITDLKNSMYKAQLTNEYEKKYKHEIDIKINEAKELISKEITPAIRNAGTELDTQMDKLIDEVIFYQRRYRSDHQKLLEKKMELQRILALQSILSVFKVVGSVVSLLGPEGEMAGSVIEIGTNIAEPFVTDNAENQIKALELPQSVTELQSLNDKIINITNHKITCLTKSLKEIINYPVPSSSELLSIDSKLNKLDKNETNLKEIEALETELIAELRSIGRKADQRNKTLLAFIKKSEKNVQFCTLLSNSYSKYENNGEKLEAMNSAIADNEEKMKNLKQYEQTIYSSIIPMLKNIQGDLQVIIDKLGTQSKVSLDVKRWHVNTVLRDITFVMHELTEGFKVEDSLARCFEKMQEGMNALINVYQHIQSYQKDQNLATYIAKISSISDTDIIIRNNAVLQGNLRKAINSLEITVRSNIVIQRYKIAISAFKQFVFPFAHKYFKDLIVPWHFILSDGKSETTLENLVFDAAIELEKIKSKLEEYKIAVTSHDGCIGSGEFRSGYVSSKPFFVWKNEQYKDMISNLLSGSTVTVKADVQNSDPDNDAIKFSVIDFNFKSRDERLQAEINNKLRGFQITVDHLGNSDYRYENKIYEMMKSSQEIWYYFEKYKDGEPVRNSLSYDKIKHSNVTLSPYASWKIRLDNVTDDISFEDLKKYKDFVDLSLEGRGYFLNKRSRNCVDLMVDKYYKAIGYVGSKDESYREEIPYSTQNNTLKGSKVFERFFLN